LADTQASYQAHIKELKERIGQLETIRGQVPDALLDQARAALAQGDQSEADRLFAQFEEQSTRADDESTRTAAEVAYQLSRIARDNIRLVPVDNSLIFINFMNRLRAKRTDSLTNRFFLLSIRPI